MRVPDSLALPDLRSHPLRLQRLERHGTSDLVAMRSPCGLPMRVSVWNKRALRKRGEDGEGDAIGSSWNEGEGKADGGVLGIIRPQEREEETVPNADIEPVPVNRQDLELCGVLQAQWMWYCPCQEDISCH